MKKIVIFVIIIVLFFAAISYYNTQKAREKIAGANQDEYRKIRDARLAVGEFNLAISNYIVETSNHSISVENLITYFNKASEDRTAVLNNDGTITVTNNEKEYSYNCDIVTENCKSKVVCLEQTSGGLGHDMGMCE